MMTTYKWTTPKGAKVEIDVTVEHITRKTVSADGWPVEIDCDEWSRKVERCEVNGKQTKMMELSFYRGEKIIVIDRKGKDKVMAVLPKDVAEAIYGEEHRLNAEKLAKAEAVEKKYNEHREMMRKVMGY